MCGVLDGLIRASSLHAHSLVACGSVVLCCTTGPEGKPGWEDPAPLSRIWCLFEIFTSFREKLNIEMQMTLNDERDFKMALQKDGLKRIENALAGIDVAIAKASVEGDRIAILRDIQVHMSLVDFNKRVRAGLRDEYRRILASSMARRQSTNVRPSRSSSRSSSSSTSNISFLSFDTDDYLPGSDGDISPIGRRLSSPL